MKTHKRCSVKSSFLKSIGHCLLVFLVARPILASQIYINMGEAKTKKSLVAFPPLQYFGSPALTGFQAVGTELYNTVNNDLSVSSYFQFIPSAAFVEDTTKTGLRPKPGDPGGFDFKSWTAVSADFLIRAAFSIVGTELTFETYLYQVSKSSLVFSKKYKGPTIAVRRIAHTFSNDVLKELTGREGMYLSKIVVSSDRNVKPFKEIYTMDWDGAQVNKVTALKTLSISPNWSQDAKKIAFTSYVQKRGQRNADLFLLDLMSGKRISVSNRTGINSGASFAPDNRHIFLTVSHGVSPDIYKVNFEGALIKRITEGPTGAMNVEPAVSPDGKKIAFSSDRAGRPMIYVMDIDGKNITRLTFGGDFNASPTWSPDGQSIAFAGQTGTNFDIFVIGVTDKNKLIRLTEAKKANGKPASNEDPSFSPDGRFVMYTSDRTGSNQIYISTVDGSEERRVTQDQHNYFKPKWSPNID
jgi:TolB protein